MVAGFAQVHGFLSSELTYLQVHSPNNIYISKSKPKPKKEKQTTIHMLETINASDFAVEVLLYVGNDF
jgi:hypothetical protein